MRVPEKGHGTAKNDFSEGSEDSTPVFQTVLWNKKQATLICIDATWYSLPTQYIHPTWYSHPLGVSGTVASGLGDPGVRL